MTERKKDFLNRVGYLLALTSLIAVFFHMGKIDGIKSVVIPPCPEQHWEFRIPTVTELQVFLETTPDGVMGKKTLAKWQEYINNERAMKWFDPNSYDASDPNGK